MFQDPLDCHQTTLPRMLFLLSSPILLYLASATLCPDLAIRASDFDLEQHHVDVRPIFFFTIGVLFIVLIPEAIMMSRCEVKLLERDNIMRMIAAALFLASPALIRRWEVLDLALPCAVVGLLIIQLLWAGPIHDPVQCP